MLNNTQKTILDYIVNLINTHHMPVMIPYNILSEVFDISEMTVKRNIDVLINNKLLYKEYIGNSFIYDTYPISLDNDIKCYIKNTSD